MILKNARLVFRRKGFLNTTMKDIIDECGISRGGIYLYFPSIDEIFQEIVLTRDKSKFSAIRQAADNNEPFYTVLANYLALQKERLLQMENSLLRAMYEYIFSRADGATHDFRCAQLDNIRKSVLCILMLGVSQGVIQNKNIEIIADNFLLVIEGLGVLALSNILTEKIIDEQFATLNLLIENIKISKEVDV
jgi:AcrR family transcriptional regulator